MSDSGGEDRGGERHNKRSRKELQQDLRALQAENLRLTEENQQRIEAQAAEAQPPQDEDAHQANKNEAEDRVLTKIHCKSIAASAGRRAAILHMPFMDDDYLFDHRIREVLPRLITEIKKASLDPSDPEADADGKPLDDQFNAKKWWDSWRFDVPDAVDMVREVLFHMPPGAAKWWFKDWFKDSFLEGHRKIRGDIVFHIAKNHNLIFGIVNTQFRDKKLRATLPEESAIASGVRSKKARNAHSGLWHIKEVTPAVIAFAVTAIDYVLSGEGSFEKSTPESDYFEFFRGRITMLAKLYEKHIDIFNNLINYLNQSVLPDQYPPGPGAEVARDPLPRGLSQRDIEFMEGW